MLHIRSCASSLVILMALGLAASAHAADPAPATMATVKIKAPIPVIDFFKKPEFSGLTMSPNGRFIAALRPVDGLKKLVVIDLETKTSVVAASSAEFDVRQAAWINNNRLRYSVGKEDAGTGEYIGGGGLFVIDRDGKNPRTITATAKTREGRPLSFLANVPEPDSNDIFVVGNERNAKQTDVYRYDTMTGKKTLLTFDAPLQAGQWVLDKAGVPRAAVSIIDSKVTVWYRDSASSPYRTLTTFNSLDKAGFTPLDFDFDNKTMYVTGRPDGRDKAAIFKYDFAKNQVDPTPVFADKNMDVEGGLIFSRKKQALIGLQLEADKLRFTWTDPAMQTLQASIDDALPGKVNIITSGLTEKSPLMMVFSYSDRDPGSYYLYDDSKKDLQFLLQPRDWIDPEQMAEVRPIRYKARDGLEIPAYVTLPNGSAGKKLPLVVFPHGGPWVRGERWGWRPDTQFMASRGYAVLQMEFRGSMGYGYDHVQKSFKQWGLSMQDDLTDGINYLVAQGIVDKDRVCIAGGSYGGYAVMMGLAKDPDLYRCGINLYGVTDPMLLYTTTWSDTSGSDAEKYTMPVMLGDPVKDAALLKAASPLQNASKITKPVFMAYGGADVRVPLIHGEKMRDILKGKVAVEWVVYPDEGHGWNKTVNNVDFWTRAEAFLNKNTAPK